jgi:Na+/citrate or Na+/malate symporter
MEFLDPIMGYIQPVIDFFMPGLVVHAGDGAMVNWMPLGIQLGVIALVLALLMREFGAILIFTVVGVIIHVIVDVVMPMVRGGEGAAAFDASAFFSQFADMNYLLYLGALATGYFLAIIVLSILKGLVFRGD